MNDLVRLLGLLPPDVRGYVVTLAAALLVLQVLVSVVVQALPVSAARNPRWGGLVRAMHTFGHMRFADELGTLKLPGADLVPDPRDATIAAQRAYLAQLEAQRDEGERVIPTGIDAPAPISPMPPDGGAR